MFCQRGPLDIPLTLPAVYIKCLSFLSYPLIPFQPRQPVYFHFPDQRTRQTHTLRLWWRSNWTTALGGWINDVLPVLSELSPSISGICISSMQLTLLSIPTCTEWEGAESKCWSRTLQRDTWTPSHWDGPVLSSSLRQNSSLLPHLNCHITQSPSRLLSPAYQYVY